MGYKEGFLQKQGKRKVQGYKKRWFVLNGTIIKYFASQEISENSLLGVIDTAKVVSVKHNKHVKFGFEVATVARTYYMSAKTSEERDEWMKAIQLAVEEARRLTTSHSETSPFINESDKSYQLVGGKKQNSQSNETSSSAEYCLVGGASQNEANISPMYNVVGRPSNPLDLYGVVSTRSPAAAINYDKGEESIYDVIGTSSTQSTRSVPLNDTPAGSTSDSEVFYDSADNLKQGMTSFLSKLSMESLDSIDSIDATDDDDDIDDVETDGDVHGSDSHVNDGLTQIAEKVLPQPVDGKKYATERIKEFFKSQGIQPSGNVNYEKIDKDFNLKLDPKSDTPAFDALKKFLLHCQ